MAAVTSTYARAFTDVVLEKRLDGARILQELHALSATLAESPELRRVLQNPSIPAQQKRGLLDVIVSREKISPQVRNFAAVLIDHRRIQFFDEIVRHFEQELNARLGFAEAVITSARELSPEERRDLEARVQQLIGKKVKARYARDGELLGGAIVKVGSTIYDGSVLGQLAKIREQIIGSGI
jgi:F-type H+-transporting ATPase subunit delta